MRENERASWIERCETELAQEYYEEALEAFEHALKLDPKHALAWGGKANALGLLHRAPEALAAYQRALELDPINASFTQGKEERCWASSAAKQP